MRKLRLDSLQVESFATTAGIERVRGTVEGHFLDAEYRTGGTTSSTVVSWTYDRDCTDTQHLDCTFGCSQVSGCDQICEKEPIREPK
jgi:hypothetical protein